MWHSFYFGRINRDILCLSSLLTQKNFVHVFCTPSSRTDAHKLKILKDI